MKAKLKTSMVRVTDRLLATGVRACAILAPVCVWAQGAPPEPTATRFPAPWVGYAVVFVLLAIVLVASLLPSKRGHQD